MDGSRFDLLARTLSGAGAVSGSGPGSGSGSRRVLLQVIAALALLAGLGRPDDAEAASCASKCRHRDRKKVRRRCRRKCRKRRRNKPGPPECTASDDCPAGEVCEDGECLTDPDHCTGNGDCDDCETCNAGACVSDCAQGDVCHNGECCQPATECPAGRDCGVRSDGCGGLLRCGPSACDNEYLCVDNQCFCPNGHAECNGVCCQSGVVCAGGNGDCCEPSCEGKACGDDDGCGGVCQNGPCPDCHFCRDGTCVQEFPGTPCDGANDADVCRFDGTCGVFTCEDGNDDDCPGDCRCATYTFSNLCYEGTERGCPGAESCADDFQCPPGFQCTPCPGPIGSRCVPLCSG